MRLRVLYGFDGRTATGVIWTCTCITYYMYTANLNVKAIYNREASLPKTSLIFTPVTLRTLVGFMLHSDSFRGFFYFSCIWQLHKCTQFNSYSIFVVQFTENCRELLHFFSLDVFEPYAAFYNFLTCFSSFFLFTFYVI